MRNFRNLEIWKQGIEIAKEIYLLSEKLPSYEKYGLRSQITRAAISIPSNIAEGCSRNSETEFKRFLEISMGSLFELETQLIIINEMNLIPNHDSKSQLELIRKQGRMTNSLISKIKNG